MFHINLLPGPGLSSNDSLQMPESIEYLYESLIVRLALHFYFILRYTFFSFNYGHSKGGEFSTCCDVNAAEWQLPFCRQSLKALDFSNLMSRCLLRYV